MKLSTITPRFAMAEALSRADSGADLVSQHDAQVLLAARGADLDRLLLIASRLRDEGLIRAGRPGVITYSKKVFLPITKLCRDRCHYCVFVQSPAKLAAKGEPLFMPPEEIVRVAAQGATLGCKEALFTLGDRPETRWPAARSWLEQHGFASTLEYVRAMAILVREETGLLPHLNPGVMSWSELQRLRPVAPSMGMMLETTSVRLWAQKGEVHYGSVDKEPALRMRVLEDAGRSRIPFTTGLLLGIGENNAERAEAIFAIRAAHERYGHIQETIVQNFRAKPKTVLADKDHLGLQEYLAAVAVTRLVMGPDATVQAPPNLSDETELALLIQAGIDDWGGVSPLTPDHVNPERPWPNIDRLAQLTHAAGYQLRERLTVHPPYIAAGQTWIDAGLRPRVTALADSTSHLASVGGIPAPSVPTPARRLSQQIGSILRRAADNPSGLSDTEYVALLAADQLELDALCGIADEVRRDAVGDEVTYVVNRNLDASLFRPEQPASEVSTRFLSAHLVTALAREAGSLGATEMCVQGQIPSDLDADLYCELVRLIRSAQPEMHIHAYRVTEILDGAARLGLSVLDFLLELRAAGVDTIPGSGARILDDRIRAVLSDNTDPPVSDWVDVIKTANGLGMKSTATMVFGHIESPAEQVAHLRLIRSIQDASGGFTEFIPMPFMPLEAPAALQMPVNAPAGERLPVEATAVQRAIARPGPDLREIRAVHAVSRLILQGSIHNIQASWTKLGFSASQTVLQGGVNDLGGLLLDGEIMPEAGPESYRVLSQSDVEFITAEIGRPTRQRTTDYRSVHAPQLSHQAESRGTSRNDGNG